MEESVTKGWGFPGTSRKCHYFTGSSMSLCGRWGFYFGPTEAPDSRNGPDDCAKCTKELVKIDAARAKGKGEAS